MSGQTKKPPVVKQPHPGRRLLALGTLIVALIGSIGFGTIFSTAHWYPKLALDLQGGTEVILTPELTADGAGQKITQNDITQAIEVIRRRIDASGVSEAEVTSQGGSNIVVGIPGKPSEETINLVRTSAVLRMRPVLQVVDQVVTDKNEIIKIADTNKDGKLSDSYSTTPTNSWDQHWVTEALVAQAIELNCAQNTKPAADDPTKPLVACYDDKNHNYKYILGPSAVNGVDIKRATAGPRMNSQGNQIGGYQVNLEFNNTGADNFGKVTTALYKLPAPTNEFAIVIDGRVISTPVPEGPITAGGAVITGNFTLASAKNIANQLSFGSLPINFTVQSEEQISATLGAQSLQVGLVAGAVGIVAVFIFLIWLYRALGLLAIISLSLGSVLTYFIVTFLSWTLGYRISLPAVVSIVISIGIMADSFIVYFERIKDEMRVGVAIPRAIDSGWRRAIRTILISDTVNFVAAAILYLLAVGGVSGFAFLLGLTTIVDLMVVLLFTRPIMQLLAHTKFVGAGHRLAGLSYEMLDMPVHPTAALFDKPKVKKSVKPAVFSDQTSSTVTDNAISTRKVMTATNSTMTIAERKAAQKKAKKVEDIQTDDLSGEQEGAK